MCLQVSPAGCWWTCSQKCDKTWRQVTRLRTRPRPEESAGFTAKLAPLFKGPYRAELSLTKFIMMPTSESVPDWATGDDGEEAWTSSLWVMRSPGQMEMEPSTSLSGSHLSRLLPHSSWSPPPRKVWVRNHLVPVFMVFNISNLCETRQHIKSDEDLTMLAWQPLIHRFHL